MSQGAFIGANGEASFRLWAPHAHEVTVEFSDADAADIYVGDEGLRICGTLSLSRADRNGFWEASTADRTLSSVERLYRYRIGDGRGGSVVRRDPYARQTLGGRSRWCVLGDHGRSFSWSDGAARWSPPPFHKYIIYEMHVGSFTADGTLAAAAQKLAHIRDLGFTAVELMPVAEFSETMENWGYNPRQLFALHPRYGSPDDLRRFADEAHGMGLAVIVDVVLHHGAVNDNELWDYDGWQHDGGIYHERAGDTQWGRAFAFWKSEVREMLVDACEMWLSEEYRCDGLRFDSANDLPTEVSQQLTYAVRRRYPGRLLTAEVTPENPQKLHELGFDSLWVHSGYFDVIQQHRALGRGHHGGGDFAEGWNLPRLRTVMALHYGFEKPTQCVKYMLGSHDQVGCQHGGAIYEDYKMIGGQHRYAVDQFGGGRGDPNALNCVRLWFAANVGAAGLVLVFMGSEWAQYAWWHNDAHHRLKWELAEDDVGKRTLRFFRDAIALRSTYACLQEGGVRILHEDRASGVMAAERTLKDERVVIVVNPGQGRWTDGNYGVWVGHGTFEEAFCSMQPEYTGWGNDAVASNGGRRIVESGGRIHINLPQQCTLFFAQV